MKLQETKIPVLLRPIEIALLLAYTKANHARSFNVGDLEEEYWKDISKALLEALQP